MFTKESTQEAIEECFACIEEFNHEHNNRAREMYVKVCIAGVDGGGLSTYGKSHIISASSDEYECLDGFLRISGSREYYNARVSKREREKRMAFIQYESIVSIECEPSVYV